MTTTEQYINAIIQRELKARMELLEKILKANGYEVTAEKELLIIKHPNGFTTKAYFNKSKMRNTILEGGVKALSASDKEAQKNYLKGGSDALSQERPEYVKKYYQSLEHATLANQKSKPSRKQELEATVTSVPEKEDPTPER